jgi:hypothetical protein
MVRVRAAISGSSMHRDGMHGLVGQPGKRGAGVLHG